MSHNYDILRRRISSRPLTVYANDIADGYSNAEIAHRLGVRYETVTTNIWRLRLRMRLPLPEYARNEELPQELRRRGYGTRPKEGQL